MKHTKGEWFFRLGINENLVYSEGYGAICKIPHKGKALEEHQANTILLAAAKELLEACKQAMELIRFQNLEDAPIVNEIEKAIKKAVG